MAKQVLQFWSTCEKSNTSVGARERERERERGCIWERDAKILNGKKLIGPNYWSEGSFCKISKIDSLDQQTLVAHSWCVCVSLSFTFQLSLSLSFSAYLILEQTKWKVPTDDYRVKIVMCKFQRKLFPKLQFNLSSTSSSTKFNRNMKTKCFPIMLKFVGFWSFLKIKL